MKFSWSNERAEIVQGYRKWASVIFIWAWKFIIRTEHQTKFNYRFLFYIRFQTHRTRRKNTGRITTTHNVISYHTSNTCGYCFLVGAKHSTAIIGRRLTLYCVVAKPISSHGQLFCVYHIYTNHLHINSIHAASLSWNIFISFLCFGAATTHTDFSFCCSQSQHLLRFVSTCIFEIDIDGGSQFHVVAVVVASVFVIVLLLFMSLIHWKICRHNSRHSTQTHSFVCMFVYAVGSLLINRLFLDELALATQ